MHNDEEEHTEDKNTEEDSKSNIKVFLVEAVIVFTVLIVLPFAISGVWPPLLNVISGSMEPTIETGDIVYVVDNDRYGSSDSVYANIETKYDNDGDGDIVIFQPNNKDQTPVIHRAMLYVEENENWVKSVNEENLNGETCDTIEHCPAPHEGLITKGDNNTTYDQANDISRPVKEEWIQSKHVFTIPFIGRLSP